jgi:hypothetical protein
MPYRSAFIAAIHAKTKIKLSFFSKKDGQIITRMCAPMDFGPSRRNIKDKSDRYHLWDYESESENHVLSLLPNQVSNMVFTYVEFDPSEFVSWRTNWFIQRNWGMFS